MSEPTITVLESQAAEWRTVPRVMSLDEIEELFRDEDHSIVWPLCKLVRQQMAEIERLETENELLKDDVRGSHD